MRKFGFLLMIALPALSGCAGWPDTYNARPVVPGGSHVLEPDEIIVFGRILFIENGKEKAPYGLGKPFWQLANPESKPGTEGQADKRWIIPFLSTDKDGFFAYAIPAGHYEMTFVAPFYYLPMIDPALEFDASTPGRAYYLGELEVDFDATTWLGGLWGNYITHLNQLEVLDRFSESSGQFGARGTGSDSIGKALLARIHGRIPELKSTAPGDMLVAPAGSIRFGK